MYAMGYHTYQQFLQLEHTTLSCQSIYAFWNLISHLKIVVQTLTFVREINELPLSGKFMVSFDVESLFPNIPLEECINLVVDYIPKGNTDLQLTKTELRNLLLKHISCLKVRFLIKLMGGNGLSPSPVLANLFMGHHERIWLENYKASSISFYQRYNVC